MIEEIKRRLENGEVVELECVDEEKYLDLETCWRDSRQIILDSSLIVTGIYGINKNNLELEGVNRIIPHSHFKHFRVKRPAPTFNDLIDVAIQAYKDGVIKSLKLLDYGVHSLSYSVAPGIDENTIFSQHKDYSYDINFINSLYTETFVIESEEDINKVNSREEISFSKKHMTVAKLMNGNEILITRLDSDNSTDVVVYMRNGLYKNYLDIEVLKGATVTQKRGK